MSYLSCPVCGLFAEHGINKGWWSCSECKTEWLAHQVVIRQPFTHPVPAMLLLKAQLAEAERQRDELLAACEAVLDGACKSEYPDEIVIDAGAYHLVVDALASVKGGSQ